MRVWKQRSDVSGVMQCPRDTAAKCTSEVYFFFNVEVPCKADMYELGELCQQPLVSSLAEARQKSHIAMHEMDEIPYVHPSALDTSVKLNRKSLKCALSAIKTAHKQLQVTTFSCKK